MRLHEVSGEILLDRIVPNPEALGRFDVPEYTYVVDFAKTPSFIDPTAADACIEVMTSDRTTGTLSHLTIGNDPEQFASDLRALLGKKGIPVCLAGGLASTAPFPLTSTGLADRLTAALFREGFLVSQHDPHADLFGYFTRTSELYPDRVVVSRTAYGPTPHTERKILTFPQ